MISPETLEWLVKQEFSVTVYYTPRMEVENTDTGETKIFEPEFKLLAKHWELRIGKAIEVIEKLEKEGWEFQHFQGDDQFSVVMLFSRRADEP